MSKSDKISPKGESLKYANEYWAYIRNVVAKYADKEDNDGKRIIKSAN